MNSSEIPINRAISENSFKILTYLNQYDNNVVISVGNLYVILGMIQIGADGLSAHQLTNFLQFDFYQYIQKTLKMYESKSEIEGDSSISRNSDKDSTSMHRQSIQKSVSSGKNLMLQLLINNSNKGFKNFRNSLVTNVNHNEYEENHSDLTKNVFMPENNSTCAQRPNNIDYDNNSVFPTGTTDEPFINKTDYVRTNYHMFAGTEIKSDFTKSIKNLFNAHVSNIDFKSVNTATKTINNWFSVNTENKINDLFSPNDFSIFTKAVLVGTIAFKQSWKYKFPVENSFEEKFHTTVFNKVSNIEGLETAVISSRPSSLAQTDLHPQQLKIMFRMTKFMYEKIKCNYFENELVQMISLPYQNPRYSAVFVLPANPTIHIAEIMTQCNVEDFIPDMMDQGEVSVHVQIPKLKLFNKMQLKDLLEKLGIIDIFSKKNCNLSKMTDDKVFVDKIVQVTSFEIDEHGTEAAVATAAVIQKRMAMPGVTPPKNFRANRPYLILIFDDTLGTHIFTALVNDPNKI